MNVRITSGERASQTPQYPKRVSKDHLHGASWAWAQVDRGALWLAEPLDDKQTGC